MSTSRSGGRRRGRHLDRAELAGRRPPATVSPESLQGLRDGSDRCGDSLSEGAPRPARLRLARLDMTVWFASERLAAICERTLVRRKNEDPFATHADIYAMDAEAEGWDTRRGGRSRRAFSSREFDRVLAAGNKRGFYHHEAPSWQFYDREVRSACRRFRPNSAFRRGRPARRSASFCTGPMPLPGHAPDPRRHARAERARCAHRRGQRLGKVRHDACRVVERPE